MIITVYLIAIAIYQSFAYAAPQLSIQDDSVLDETDYFRSLPGDPLNQVLNPLLGKMTQFSDQLKNVKNSANIMEMLKKNGIQSFANDSSRRVLRDKLIDIARVSHAPNSTLIRLLETPFNLNDDLQAFQTLKDIMKHFIQVNDGRAYFSMLYVAITQNAYKALNGELNINFKNQTWVKQNIASFADLFRKALYNYESRNYVEVPLSWLALFVLSSQKLSIIQYFILGINAHINRDLPFSNDRVLHLVSDDPTTRLYDYLQYNKLIKITALPVIESIVNLYLKPFDTNVPESIKEISVSVIDQLTYQSISVLRNIAWYHGSSFANKEIISGQNRTEFKCNYWCKNRHMLEIEVFADSLAFTALTIIDPFTLKLLRYIEGRQQLQSFCKYDPWKLCEIQ